MTMWIRTLPLTLLLPGCLNINDLDDALLDDDGDGFSEEAGDCDDSNQNVNPDASEWCNDIDDDCDGEIDEFGVIDGDTWYLDADGDGYGSEAASDTVTACEQPEGYLEITGDCDDGDATIHPGAAELSDGLDNNCDGFVDALSLAAGAARLGGESDGDLAGAALASCDLNGDGMLDLVVGAPGQDGASTNAGGVYLLLEHISGEVPLAEATATLYGMDVDDGAGSALAALGDLDGDGYDDLLLGVPWEDSSGFEAGAAYVIYGPATAGGSLSQVQTKYTGGEARGDAGYALAPMDDADGAGTPGFLVAAPGHDGGAEDGGSVYIHAGPLDGIFNLPDSMARLNGEVQGGAAGFSVANAGDTDGDGFQDVLVGAPGDGSEGDGAGFAYVASGPFDGTRPLSESHLTLAGENPGDQAGFAVASAGDVTGDGHPDLLVGAPAGDEQAEDGGVVYLVEGDLTGTFSLGEATARFLGEVEDCQAGYAVAGPGDFNGDGTPDLAMGAPCPDSEHEYGAVYLLAGPAQGVVLLGDAELMWSGEAAGDQGGVSLAAAGDVDGDGLQDLLAGATAADDGRADPGAAYLLLGMVF